MRSRISKGDKTESQQPSRYPSWIGLSQMEQFDKAAQTFEEGIRQNREAPIYLTRHAYDKLRLTKWCA
jgi:hypothetical protein